MLLVPCELYMAKPCLACTGKPLVFRVCEPIKYVGFFYGLAINDKYFDNGL